MGHKLRDTTPRPNYLTRTYTSAEQVKIDMSSDCKIVSMASNEHRICVFKLKQPCDQKIISLADYKQNTLIGYKISETFSDPSSGQFFLVMDLSPPVDQTVTTCTSLAELETAVEEVKNSAGQIITHLCWSDKTGEYMMVA